MKEPRMAEVAVQEPVPVEEDLPHPADLMALTEALFGALEAAAGIVSDHFMR